MTVGGAGEDDSSAIRPFLDRAGAGAFGPDHRGPAAAEDGAAGVRPYYVTRGRVASADDRVRVETVLVARPEAPEGLPSHAREHHRLVALAVRPISVAELAVAMGLPIGVVLVLVGDLAREGRLTVSNPTIAPRDDVALIRRLIDGVCAL